MGVQGVSGRPPLLPGPRVTCPACIAAGDPSAQCLRHGFMLHTKYQVVYPFPTFQPAFQLKKDQVVLLNTSYSLVACAVSAHSAGRSLDSSHGHSQALE